MQLNWKKYFMYASLICWALQIAGAVISIGLSMPAQATMGNLPLSPADASPMLVLQDFVFNGTALAPPLTLVIIFGLLCLLASRKGAAGTVGMLLLAILGILFTFAALGEYAQPDRFPHMPGFLYIALLLINQISITAVTVLGPAAVVAQRIFMQAAK